ncbi:Terminase, ATPase subunit [Escherichia coli]|nr:Terminase, ATPase subunit [Escherichia coli]
MTRRKVRRTATVPDAWWWHRQPCRAASSAFLSVTSGAGWTFAPRLTPSKKLTEQYNVTYIGIDSTGVGHGVYENVKAFFPAVREFVYNPNVKNALLLKAYDIISHRRLEFDAGHTDIAQSFMAIRRATTASGNRPTYEASRSEEASHADLAWATIARTV